MIYTKKGSLLRTFSEMQWKLLGKGKNDWEQISESDYAQLAGQKKTITAKKVTIPSFPNKQGQVVDAGVNKFQAIDLTVKKSEEDEKLRVAKLDADRVEKLKALGVNDIQLTEVRRMVNLGALNEDEFDEIYNQAKESIAAESGNASNDGKTETPGETEKKDNTEKTDGAEKTTAPVIPSSQFAVKGAKDHIDTLTTVEAIAAFIKNDTRKLIKDHAAKAVKNLTNK